MSCDAPAGWLLSDAPREPLSPEQRIAANFAEYSWFLERAERAHARGRGQSAAIYASLAALVAAHRHCGFFSSPRLEKILLDLGRTLPDHTDYRRPARKTDAPLRILHVCSEIVEVGGHSRMLARWMREDNATKQHSLVLTSHERETPKFIEDAVKIGGGKLHRIDLTPSPLAQRALELRRLSREYDLVVTHTYSQDVIPIMAFARPDTTPPVMLLNHADHMFWLGVGVSDVVINLRNAAEDLSIERRHVEIVRNAMVPTIVSPTTRKRTKEDAKRELGLDANKLLLLSVARGAKYRTLNGITFADTHVPVLKDNPDAIMMVLGVGAPDDWGPAIEATGGRIIPLAAVNDPTLYFEAADIYVDSFPFVSSTSMMEAAGYALPMVSRFYAPKEASIVGINHPGLIAASLPATNDEQYVSILRRLIAEPDYRAERGKIAETAVRDLHVPPGWTRFWEESIEKAFSLPPIDGSRFANLPAEKPFMGEPDVRMFDLFGIAYPTARIMAPVLADLPIGEHYARWLDVYRARGFTGKAEALWRLQPQWAIQLLKIPRPWVG